MGRGELRWRGGNVAVANSAGRRAPLAPSVRRRRGLRGRRAPLVPSALWRRGGDGHSVVRGKGEGDEKRQVRGRGGGEKEARQKMRAAIGTDVVDVRWCALRLLIIISVELHSIYPALYDRTQPGLRRDCNDTRGDRDI